jgi:hypothetical protein
MTENVMKEETKERLIEMLCTSPIVEAAVGCVVIGIAICLGVFSSIPSWIYVLIGLAGWCFIGATCWRYESWRASGPRGTYWNPSGVCYGVTTPLIWGFFGIFLSIAHSFCRRGYWRWCVEKIMSF